ncbi:MAG: hypothetical protein C4534_08220 [Gaiellales bacterium]|nr:MAG: hypothetical protein C4534_08220 [Gaiellales bacterium]
MARSVILGYDANNNPIEVLVDSAGRLIISPDTGLTVGIDQVTPNANGIVVVSALPAGTDSIGAVKDDGPQTNGVETYTTSADMTGAADIGPAPSAGERSRLLQATISVAADMEVTLLEETTGTVRYSWFLPANGTLIFVPRYPPTLATVDKKWRADASAAGNIRITTVTVSVP